MKGNYLVTSAIHVKTQRGFYFIQIIFLYTFVMYIPSVADWSVIWSWWYWFHFLPSETGPVVPKDIMSPAWQGLVTVADHLGALFCVLQRRQRWASQVTLKPVMWTHKPKSEQAHKEVKLKVICNTLCKSMPPSWWDTAPLNKHGHIFCLIWFILKPNKVKVAMMGPGECTVHNMRQVTL